MAVLNDAVVGANIMTIGQVAAVPAHFVSRALPAFGHYRYSHRFDILLSQGANTRLFEIRNPHPTNSMVLEKLRISCLQTGTSTSAGPASLDVYKATEFTLVDTGQTVTIPETLLMKGMSSSDFRARGVTVAGNILGMTLGTLTLEASPFLQLWMRKLLTLPTAGPVPFYVLEYAPVREEMPVIFGFNEGLVITNGPVQVLLGTSSAYIDVQVSGVSAY